MIQAFLYGIKGQCMNGQVLEIDNKYRWFCRTCYKKCHITDSRQPAIFHIEWSSSRIGDECVGLASKLHILQKTSVEKKLEQRVNKNVYYINAARKARQIRKFFLFKNRYKPCRMFKRGFIKRDLKFSCKGVQKNRIKNPLNKMLNVLRSGCVRQTVNMGFRMKDNQIFSYEMTKCGMTFLYYKRYVHSDLINTSSVNFTLIPF